MIWFSADWHLGHKAILKHQPQRKFDSFEKMDFEIIEQINLHVQPKDILYFLGDFCWRNPGHYRQQLKVRQILACRGNHDAASLSKHFSCMELMLFVKFNNIKMHLCHYPLRSWGAMHYGGRHLYGHCHGTIESLPGSLDVGIDNAFFVLGEFRPFSLDEVLHLTKC